MDPAIIGVFIPIIALSGGTILIALKMRYTHLEKNRIGGDGRQEVEHLADGVDSLRAEVEMLRDEFHKLDERMDFTERLLERPKTEE
jgi:hypothetical protein